MEPPLPVVPGQGDLPVAAFMEAVTRDRLFGRAIAGDLQRPVSGRTCARRRRGRHALLGLAGRSILSRETADATLAAQRPSVSGLLNSRSIRRRARSWQRCCRGSSASGSRASTAARWCSAGRRATSTSSSIASPRALAAITTSITDRAFARSHCASTTSNGPCAGPRNWARKPSISRSALAN